MKSLVAPLAALLLSGCSSMLYYPTHVLHFPPEARGYHPENVEFTSSDGTKLFGWLFHHDGSAGKPKALFVFYHGNGENLSSHYLNLLWVLKEGFDFFIFDYRGYGLSQGSPDPRGTAADGEAALRLMRARYKGTPIVILGQSLGGAVALRNAIDLRGEIAPKAVVIESSFASYQEVGRRILGRTILTWPFQWLPWLVLSDRYAPDGDLARLSPVPLLVMHAEHDEVVPFRCGEEIYDQAAPPKDFWKIPGNGHADAYLRFGDEYRRKLLAWLEPKLGEDVKALALFLLLLTPLARADQASELAHSPRWLRLLHYKTHWLTGTHSSVSGDGFFFAPKGRRDPEAELRATIEAFRSDKKISKLPQPAACAFPARFRFLNESLHLGLPQPSCPRWDEFLARFHGYESVTLVFSTAFPNNPASMFGHSFLRINAKQPKLDLLDTGLSYAAQVAPDENNFSFIFLGLTGGYPGTFSAVPYYAKVAEYNDSESRDLWEYDLNLDSAETWWLLANVWELEVNAFSDYYFFDENCSYEILTLLDVAKPEWNVSPYFFHNIPSETIKRVTSTPGAVKSVRFRPSLFRRLNAYGDRLSPREREDFFGEIGGHQAAHPSAATLDAAAQYFYYRKQGHPLSPEDARNFRQVLLARASLGVPPSPEPAYDESSRPDWGHHASRVSLGEGVQRGSGSDYGAFTELAIKPAYHDLLNHDVGFVPFSEISFPHVTLREYGKESRFYVQQLEFLRINSLSPWSWLKHSLSWRAAFDYQVPDDLCSFCHVLHGEGSVGISEPIAKDRLRAYQLLGLALEAGKPLARRWRVGPLVTAGLLANASERWKHWVEAALSTDPFRLGSGQRAFLSAQWGQSFFFSPSWEARLTGRATLTDSTPRGEASLRALYYF